MNEKKKALIVGATGLVGRQVLNVLLANDYYEEIIILGRSSTGVKDNRINEIVIDFDDLKNHTDELSANDYYCCIGTTLKAAGSKEKFHLIDFTYPVEIAKLAQKDPLFEQFLIVSSLGANQKSVLFYNKIKGKLENRLKKIGLKSLHIFQPSLLVGERKDFRPAEAIAGMFSSILSFFVIGSSRRFFAIEGVDVAKSMFLIAQKNEEGTHTHKPKEMLKISHQK